MASTVVRIYHLRPDDIEVRQAAGPDDEVVLHLGNTATVQGTPGQLVTVLRLAIERIHAESKRMAVNARGPF